MAQDIKVYQRSTPDVALIAENLAVAVPQSGDTTLLTVQTIGMVRLYLQIAVTGQTLDVFKVSAKATAGATASVLYSSAADFTSPQGLLVGTSGDLTVQAAGTTGWLILDVRGLSEVTFSASSGNAAGSTVSAYCGGA